MLFTYKLLAFSVFCFQLILQLLNFSLERFLTNNNFHIFEGSTRYWQVGGELIHQWFQEDALFYLLQLSSIHLIGYIIFLLLAKPIPFQFISTFVSLIPLSCKMFFAFKGQVSKINASAFKGHLLDFICVECVVYKLSTKSARSFVWSYILCTRGFLSGFWWFWPYNAWLTVQLHPSYHFYFSQFKKQAWYSLLCYKHAW